MSAPGATCTSRQPQLGIPITSARVALCGVHVVRLSFIILPRGLSMPLIACIISELMLCATKGPDSVQPINASALTNAAILGDASFTAQLAPERNMTTAMIVDIHTLTV